MAQLSDLPEEVLIHVFKLLDAESVENAALVCSDWNKIISTTPAIMNKFILNVYQDAYLDDGEQLNQLMSLERHFTRACIYIGENKVVKSRLTEVTEHLIVRFGSRLTKLRILCPVLGSQLLLKLLRLMPGLEELSLGLWIQPPGDTEEPTEDIPVGTVTLPKLKKLKVHQNWDAFRLIKAPSLVELETPGSEYDADLEGLDRFLKACPRLESLEADLGLFAKMEPGFPFKLKTIISPKYPFFKLDENIKKFIMSQADSMETIQAKCANSEFHEIVLTKFKQLRILDSNLKDMTATAEFFNNLKPLPQMKEIKSFYGFSTVTALRAIVGNCPGLVKLKCLCAEHIPEQLDFIAEHIKGLESLSVKSIEATSARFQCLKTLKVKSPDNTEHLIAFLKANPTIETLGIWYLHRDISDEALDALINETSLKHVLIESDSSQADKIYDRVKIGFGTWKTLELSVNNGSRTGMPIYTMKFPDDPADWDPPEHLTDNESTQNWD